MTPAQPVPTADLTRWNERAAGLFAAVEAWLSTPDPTVSAARGRELAQQCAALRDVLAVLPGASALATATRLNGLAADLAHAAGMSSALPPLGAARSGFDRVRHDALVARLRWAQGRAHYGMAPNQTHATSLADACARQLAALDMVDGAVGPSTVEPADLDWYDWRARLLTLEQAGHDPAALRAEVERGRALLASRLDLLATQLRSPDDMGVDGWGGWRGTLALAKETAGWLAAVDPAQAEPVARFPVEVNLFYAKLSDPVTSDVDGAALAQLARRHGPALPIAATRAAATGPSAFAPVTPTGVTPRRGMGPGRRRWPQRPDLPSGLSWDEVRPHAVARVEHLTETYRECGPHLVENSIERLVWLMEHLGPVVEELTGRRFDFDDIALQATTYHTVKIDQFHELDRYYSSLTGPLDDEQVNLVAASIEADIPRAVRMWRPVPHQWMPGTEPTHEFIRLLLVPPVDAHDMVTDPDRPPSDAALALDLTHEWRHHDQARLALGATWDLVAHALAMQGHGEMVEGDAIDFSHEVLTLAARRGVLDPADVTAAIEEERRLSAPAAGAPGLGLWITTCGMHAAGLANNRAMAPGLTAAGRRPLVEGVLRDPRVYGRRDGEPFPEWGLRVQTGLADAGDGRAHQSPSRWAGRVGSHRRAAGRPARRPPAR